VGLGIVVLEDPVSSLCVTFLLNSCWIIYQVSHRITVQTVQKNICLCGLSEEADDEIRPGDVLTAIERDDCRLWPLSRIRARLNSYRVPVGASVRMTFSRRVPKLSATHADPRENVPHNERDNVAFEVYPDPNMQEYMASDFQLSTSSCSDSSMQEDGNITPKATPRPKKIAVLSPPPSPPEQTEQTQASDIPLSGDTGGCTQSFSQELSGAAKSSVESAANSSSPMMNTPCGDSIEDGVLGASVVRNRFDLDEDVLNIYDFDDIDEMISGLCCGYESSDFEPIEYTYSRELYERMR
jgi:hypothetical protein